MAPIRYSLHYEDYSEHLMSRFGRLLQMQSLVDMTLMCSSHTLRVHKAVLAASSAYFQEVLQKQNGEPLIILKMRFSVLKCLVEFMYCGKTQCLEENLDELVSAAQFLKIKGLSKVTKERLGITSHSELPVFTPPVVINRPPQSMMDVLSEGSETKPAVVSQLPPVTTASQADSLGRPNKQDLVVRIPFDIENRESAPSASYGDVARNIKPRRGRPSARRSGWVESGALGRAAERALLRREQDSRKAIHQLKHLQSRHMQDYLERMTLSQAVNSICGPEVSTSHSYMNMDTDLMYMDQTVSSDILDPTMPYSKDHGISSETMTTSYTNTITTSSNTNSIGGISSAMSQYVNALKSAGLPTDLPILFESGDGSYINVNEQVLLDMVQSSEIQYEVIEQPNIIEKVSDPSEIKSIDDLSKSIERGELLKSYGSNNYNKDTSHEDAINSLNAILPDNLDSFSDQQNYVVLDPSLQESNNSMDQSNDFSCIDGDFFTKSMSEDVKKYYADQQLCPTSTTLDTNFTMSLLETKTEAPNENLTQHFGSLNSADLRRNEDCYDFGLPLPQTNDFKEVTLDCLISTPKRGGEERNTSYENNQLKMSDSRADLISDLMNIEDKINILQADSPSGKDIKKDESNIHNYNSLSESEVFDDDSHRISEVNTGTADTEISESITPSELHWNNTLVGKHTMNETDSCLNDVPKEAEPEPRHSEIELKKSLSGVGEKWTDIVANDNNKENEDTNISTSNFENTIPYAVGLLPLKQMQSTDNNSLLKRKDSNDIDLLDDTKCLKRKSKCNKSS